MLKVDPSMKPSRLSCSRSVRRTALAEPWHRWVAASLACLYLLAFTPAGLILTALLAASDGGHQVSVEETAEGARVVLHHATESPTHQHGVAARFLTLFAAPAGDDDDHVVAVGLSGVTVAPVSSPGTKLVSVSLKSAWGRAYSCGAAAPRVTCELSRLRCVAVVAAGLVPFDFGRSLARVFSTVLLL